MWLCSMACYKHSHTCAPQQLFSVFFLSLIMQSSDVDMMERERPALDEPANQKKPKVQKDEDFGGNSISGWCTMKFMEQWMGRDFAEMVAEDRSIPRRWAGQGWDKPCQEQFLITHKTTARFLNKKRFPRW